MVPAIHPPLVNLATCCHKPAAAALVETPNACSLCNRENSVRKEMKSVGKEKKWQTVDASSVQYMFPKHNLHRVLVSAQLLIVGLE